MGAEFSGKDMRPDEYLQPKLTLTYDGKRDRWNGYNTDQHQEVVEEYAKVEMAKRQLKADRLQTELMDGKLSETSIKVREEGGRVRGMEGEGCKGSYTDDPMCLYVYVFVCLCVRRLYMTVMGVTLMRRNMLTRQIWRGLNLTPRLAQPCGT